MSQLHDLLDRLWQDYAALNPQAKAIHDMLTQRGEKIVNDHIAFRTYDDPRINLDVLAAAFTPFGYEAKDQYIFTDKKLFARHFEHRDKSLPKIFISQLELAKFSPELRATVKRLVDQVPKDKLSAPDLCVSGRLWDVAYSEYEALLKESEYAGWMSAFGFRANHFTILVNELKTIKSLPEFNSLIKGLGFALNSSGGEIKGSREVLLEQSSTLAAQAVVKFNDGSRTIPACYYEFAQRYPKPNGELFTGFVEKSADKIFESTDRK
jgi:hypothetical protein